jgi:hypothetical protein
VVTRKITRKHLFADGNITSAFENFKREHKCNKYCSFYRLAKFRPPLQPWEKMKKNAQRFARELKEDAAESANVAAENTKAENAKAAAAKAKATAANAKAIAAETGEISEGGRSLRPRRH